MRSFIRKLLTLLLFSAGAAHSAEWKIEPTLGFDVGHDDNIRLSIDDEISSAEATFSPAAVFSVETPRSGLSGNLRFDFTRYEEDSNLDEDNVRFNMDTFRRMERSQVGLNVGIIKDTTLDSQLEDTGVAFERVDRLQFRGGPNWAYNINENTQAAFNYSYSDIQYKNSGGTGFVDFNIHSGQVSLQRVLNERATATIILSHSRTDNENDVKSNNSNLQGGAAYQFSETLSASLFAGVRYTETDFSQNSQIPVFAGDIIIGFIPLAEDVSNSSSGYTFSSSLNKSFLRGDTSITASRNISNSTNGIPIQVTRLSWNSLYRMSETLSADLNLSLYNSETEDSASRDLNRDFYSISPELHWDFKRFWRISGRYRYNKQTYDDTSNEATRNAAYLTLTYRWPRIATSR